MNTLRITFLLLLITVLVNEDRAESSDEQFETTETPSVENCFDVTDSHHLCSCGDEQTTYDLMKNERCIDGHIVLKEEESRDVPQSFLRLVTTPIHRSTRDAASTSVTGALLVKRKFQLMPNESIPLRNVSVEAWIDTFAADVTINQVFVNDERFPIEAIYVFPIEENAAVYSFTAQIDDRTIVAELKEKNTAEKEYKEAISQGQTAVLLRQSEQTLDTFTINVGSLAPGKTCVITIKYVSELEMVDGSSIRFVVPTTISPRYNPSLGRLQSPDATPTKYVQKTPYSLWFQAHIARGGQHKINQVANLSHPVDANISRDSIDISISGVALDRDIILDIDLPQNRPKAVISVEQDPETSTIGVLLAFTPRFADFSKIYEGHDESNTEFIFIVDCSGSMAAENRIPLAREAMLLFLRSLPLDSHFNIIRFGTNYDVLFKSKEMTAVYNETTARKAENLMRSMKADFGGTEILEPLKYLKQRPPAHGRSRQVFILTDGEVSNTDQVINLARSMSSSTRIFSFGLGDSPSRSLVKGLARATNGYFTFIPPKAKVDLYVANHFARALQPSIVDARLTWGGIDDVGRQAPTVIPPLYINDRVLVYQLFDLNDTSTNNITVTLVAGDIEFDTFDIPAIVEKSRSTIRRLAAKALIQELQHSKTNPLNDVAEEMKRLSLEYQILSPYTAFVGCERSATASKQGTGPQVRYVPIQMNQDYESASSRGFAFGSRFSASWNSGLSIGSSSNSYQGGGSSGGHGFLAGGAFRSVSRGRPMMKPVSFADYAAARGHGAASTSSVATTTTIADRPIDTSDRVRWLIDRQSYNGAWTLIDQDISKVTNGKSLHSFTTTGSYNRKVLTTALIIAVLESEHADEKNLWFAIVDKARKSLEREGLTKVELDKLIDEIEAQL